MRINAQMLVTFTGIGHGVAQESAHLAHAGYAVDGGIGFLAQPLAGIYLGIGGVGTFAQDKCSHDAAGLFKHETVSVPHIILKYGGVGIVVAPLVGIASAAHQLTGHSKHLQQPRHIVGHSRANGQDSGMVVWCSRHRLYWCRSSSVMSR